MTMKKTLIALLTFCALASCGSVQEKSDYLYKDVPFTNVHFTDNFWAPRIETIRSVTVPFAFRKCEDTHRIDNFAVAARLMEGKFNSPYPFDDSDVYKIMEGASYLMAVKKDQALDAYMDSLIHLIGAAQEPDGYLYTTRTISGASLHPWAGSKRWENERDNSHELYNVGHMYEAAVAHYLATEKRSFLDIAIKNANLLCETFGPEEGKLTVAPGHQEIEIGLVKLYKVTGDKRYLNLSEFFLDARGKYEHDHNSEDQFRNGAYWQDHKPVTEQDEAVGHAVRATYMYSAMTDVAALNNEQPYKEAVDKLWNNVVGKKLYITGGIGSTRHGEAFGKNYELPNSTAYCETCASIANCMWNLRMFMLHGDSKYIDVLERSLYNAVLSGISLDRKEFFYPNVLTCDESGSERSEWFDCSCCPSNLSRFIPSVPGYVYAVSPKGFYVNLYGASEADIVLNNGKHVKLTQQTGYPWDGKIKLELVPEAAGSFDVMLRIPGWVNNQPVPSDLYHYASGEKGTVNITVNGRAKEYKVEKGYAVLSGEWKSGDVIEMDLPMDIRKSEANDKVEADVNHIAIERGPIVYCAEFADNKGAVLNYVLKPETALNTVYDDTLFGGVNLLKGYAERIVAEDNFKVIKSVTDSLTLIPYYARSHRGNGEMTVWFTSDEMILKNQLMERGRITDKVIIGNSTSEAAHNLKGKNTHTGGSNTWRDASDGGWFSYSMTVDAEKPMELVLTYLSTDGGNREFEIFVDDKKVGEQKLRPETYSAWIDKVYPIPAELTKGKKNVVVKVQALPGMIAGGVFGCRTQKQKE